MIRWRASSWTLFCSASLVACSAAVRAGAEPQSTDALPVEAAVSVQHFAEFSPIEYSPDGKWLTYVMRDNRAKKYDQQAGSRTGVPWQSIGADIVIMNIKTGGVKSLTGGKGNNWQPTWSPDGHYLGFLSDREGNGEAGLWIWDTRRDELRRVSDVNVRWDEIEWTSDSERAVVAIRPQDLSVDDYVQKLRSKSDSEKIPANKVAGSSVILYRASATADRGENAPKSDPWNLNDFLRDLAVIDIATGKVTVIVHGQRVGAKFLLSPGGSRLAYTVPKRFEMPGSQQTLFDLVTFNLSTGQSRILASDIRLGLNGAQFTWSPDGSRLSYCTAGMQEKTNDCYVVEVNAGNPHNVTNLPAGQGSVGPRTPLWDTKGMHIYFLYHGALWRAQVDKNKAVEVVQIANHSIVQMIPQSENGLWMSDEGMSTVVLTQDERTKQDGFFKIDLVGGRATKLLEDGRCYSCARQDEGKFFTLTRDEKHIAYVAEDAQHDSDVWMSDASFTDVRRLTHLNPQFDRYKMASARLIEWLSLDGELLRGALLLPADYQEGKRYPLITWVYGSERLSNNISHFGMVTPGPFNMQLLATRGYAVLLPDSPQLEGTPMLDVAKTVLPGINKVIEMGIADADRLGVMGHSNGGYSVLSLIVQTKRFKAAIELDGTANLVGEYGEMDKDGNAFGSSLLEYGQDALGGTPWQSREKYIENSPIFFLDRVETPLLIVHGTDDSTVAPFLGDEVFVGLRRLGKDVEYTKYEGEGHSPLYWSYANQMDFCNRMIAWFEKYLKDRLTPGEFVSTGPRGPGQ